MTARPWSALGDGWAFRWSPVPPHLSGSPAIVEAVWRRLLVLDPVMVTPTGPWLDTDEADPLAVWAALVEVAPGPWRGSRWTPTPPPVPPGAVA